MAAVYVDTALEHEVGVRMPRYPYGQSNAGTEVSDGDESLVRGLGLSCPDRR
jgi:cell wall-associated NlpC family hydrolase